MEYFLDNWGGFIGIAGLVITGIGVIISYLAFHRAGKARDAAAAAEVASKETRAAMTRTLTTVDLERAIALLQRLKEMHRANRWETCLEHYQPLRVLLSEIRSRHPALTSELQRTLETAILDVTEMENAIVAALRESAEITAAAEFDRTLNRIQSELESLSSSSHF